MRYEDNPAVNISTLKEMWSGTPLHYHHRLSEPRASTPALELGIAVHMCVLEPERFRSVYTVRPSWAKGNTSDGKEWLAEHADCRLLKEEDRAKCLAIRDAVLKHPAAARYLEEGGEAEKAIYWNDEETHIECKGRVDLFGPKATVGLKTARIASPPLFAVQYARLGYGLQHAFYHDGLIASGYDPGEMVEIVVESSPPHDVVVYVIPDDVLDIGRDEYRRALVQLAYCRETDTWPGYSDEAVELRLPKWAVPDDSDDLGDLDWETKQ